MARMFPHLLALAVLLVSAEAAAEPWMRSDGIFFGAGLGQASVRGADEPQSAGQLSVGWAVQLTGGAFGVEAGYLRTGGERRDARGPWATVVVRRQIAAEYEFLLRAGGDFGEFDGVMGGAGLAYRIERNRSVNLELVSRDGVDALFIGVTFFPGVSRFPPPTVY